MAITFKLLPFVFLLGIKFGTLSALPVITPWESKYIIKAGENLTLTCKSDVDVIWSCRDVLSQLVRGRKELNIDARISRKGDTYVSKLTITDASGPNSGFYFCNETRNRENVASFYLYVDDDEVLCAKPIWIPFTTEEFQPAVIPCKPTHPSIEVKLIQQKPDDLEWTYDPTIGFTPNNVTRLLVPPYACSFRKVTVKSHIIRVWVLVPRGILQTSEFFATTRCHQRCEQIVWRFNRMSMVERTSVNWFDPHGKQIQNDEKFTIEQTFWESILIIRNVTINDRGNFTAQAIKRFYHDHFTLFLDVADKPRVEIKKNQFHIVDALETVKCIVSGFPKPEIKWEFKRCIDDSCEYKSLISSETIDDAIYISSAAVRSNQSGYIKCIANNIYGIDEQISDYTVTDVKDGFKTFITEDGATFPVGSERQIQVALGSQVQFECLATTQSYSGVDWTFNYVDVLYLKPNYSLLENSKTQFSVNSTFIIYKMGYGHAGLYNCLAHSIPERKTESSEFTIEVIEPQKPRITVTNMDKPHEKIYPSNDSFTCFYEAIPRASIKWYKDGSDFFPDNTRIKFENMKQMLLFIKPNYNTDEGEYTCSVKNRMGSVSKSATLKFTNKPAGNNTSSIVAVGILLVLLIAIIVPLVYKIKRERQMKKILKEAGLANFETGAVECINPNLGIADQAQLLPYNKKSWEIPKEKIKLGKQLGAGAFGVVMEAVIERYDNNTDLKVAVKMMKRNVGDIYLIALLSELKIMVHLGKHVNVVNLIGACTKHIVQRELYVIVEFCRFGNLRNYLLHHRENFINQIDTRTEKIDYSIGADVLSRPFSVASDDSHLGPPSGMDDDKTNSIYVTETIAPIPPARSQGKKPTISNIRIPPRARSNCKRDYKGNIKPVCTKDLLIWAFQVSRGMEYLASRRVLHGDLASRNILLADKNVVKICDFGLAKRMYNNDDYKKKGRGPLPIRWMSIESMQDKVFSTQSDVWSFGIVLWEFFSLARTPYPGMAADEEILQKLVEGYRMDQPTFASKEIFLMMLKCWETEPLSRPTFQWLSDEIGSMLEESVTKFYTELNNPYLVMNKEMIQSGKNDYLQMVNPPDFKTLSSPKHPRSTLNIGCKPTRPPPLFSSP